MSRAVVDVQASVREGESIAKPLARHAVFPPMVVQMLAVGEETGQVDTMLDKVAKFYDHEVEASVDALTSLIEPLLDRHHRRRCRSRGHRPLHADVQHHQADPVGPTYVGGPGILRTSNDGSCPSGPRRRAGGVNPRGIRADIS